MSQQEKIKEMIDTAYDFDDEDLMNDNFLSKPERVAQDLAKMDKELIFPILIEMIKPENEGYIRSLIILVLGDIKDSRSERILVDLLQFDRDSAIRKEAASSLSRKKSPEVVIVLVTALHKDENADVRAEVAFSLSTLEPEGWLDQFRQAWLVEKKAIVRFRLARELAVVEGEKSQYMKALLEMKDKNQLSEFQKESVERLQADFQREDLKEVKDVMKEFYDDDDDLDLSELFG